MKLKLTAFAFAAALALPTAGQANSLTSVTCSLSNITLNFTSAVTSGDVTKVEIGETSNAKLKYELDLLSSATISGSSVSMNTDAAAKTQIKKVLPFKAHIYATGTANGVAKCNG